MYVSHPGLYNTFLTASIVTSSVYYATLLIFSMFSSKFFFASAISPEILVI
jgi:hypothetical protein